MQGPVYLNRIRIKIQCRNVPGLYRAEQALFGFVRAKLPCSHAISEKNSRVGIGYDDVDPGCSQCNGGMLPRTATAKILAGNNDFVLRFHRTLLDEFDGIEIAG